MSGAFAVGVVAALLVAYSLVARRLSTTPITGPMIFLSAGILLGPAGLDALAGFSPEAVRVIVETALVLVLFNDAASFRLRFRRSDLELPARLLGIGMPLTVILGALIAAPVVGGITPLEAVALAIILAPTDAALGQAIVSNPLVPARVRNALNIESGLNDGLAVPLLSIALAAAEAEPGSDPIRVLATFAGSLLPALIAGIAVGAVGGWLLAQATRREWTSTGWSSVAVIALAVLSYAMAQALGGSGFVAAFVGGLAFGKATRTELQHTPAESEGITHLVSLLAFLVVGSAVLDPELGALTPSMIVYAILSLTVIRMLPVAVSMIGSGLRPRTVLYVGWSGPRGLATIVFATIVLLDVPGPGATLVVTAAVVTSTISVYAHGLTAWPLSARYGEWYGRLKGTGIEPAEAEPVEQPTLRRRLEPQLAVTAEPPPDQGA